ncbi:uncharacterized protein LOC107746370 [Sinocyclocheilus rhinocerous]|uniref:uncharacterized protein LOC107746370 n=1 Tax=Sinocyclocheilus rhinocerous TaxID=307959 RepID=UPI0007B938F5|nr:PREDICTED: uncharacterized protein LOC107746370 [Sinocyclocheilus rhinocerous]XP_016416041.1 PREDICTED: uncharacterized protein LOC107746370 [Sinocyclocheilus rhinocerous]XP_016416051.1 PREDICTED: uncharacterized protein LOC107746370 [Sinocyclocheilus rhinocerous]
MMRLHSTLGTWLFTLLVMLVYCQSGDDGEWGSGDVSGTAITGNSSTSVFHAVGDEPDRTRPIFQTLAETEGGDCYVNFHTSQVISRRLRAFREEVAYLKALQHGNQAVMENLVQFVGAEMGDQRYEEVIQENIVGIREDHVSCESVVTKAAEELESQLEGDAQATLAGIQKIKEESLAFEEILRTTTDIATRLESSSRALHVEMIEQLRKNMRQPRKTK